MKISAVLTVLNEEQHIEECLKSLSFVDEIVVVDDGSTDKTIQIAKKYTKKVFAHKSVGFVEPARNFSISKATGDWILVIDADETVPQTLAEELKHITLQSEYQVVSIPRKNIIFSQWISHTGWWPDYNIRFFKKGCVTWKDEIHSKPIVDGAIVELEAVEEYALVHDNYTTVSQFLTKLNTYTTIEAQELCKKGKTFKLQYIISKPVEEFLSRFFSRKGYRDGLHGFVLSLLEAFSSFIVQIKLWEKTGFEEKEKSETWKSLKEQLFFQGKNARYWINTLAIDLEKNYVKKYMLKVKRKFS